jgi:hypothetical protein
MAVARLFRSWALRLPSKPRKPASLVACKSRRIAICFICPYLSDTMSSPDRGALSAKEDGPMARLILTSLVLAIFIHPLYAQSSLYTDRSGYTTGTQDGRSVNSYTDRYGNTTGWVGGKSQNTYSDGYGGTTGTLGNKRINTYDDGYGNTTGTIGRDRIDLHTDRSGVTTGTVGQRRLNCYSNRFSTTCY